MASEDETPTTKPEADATVAWLSKRAGLIILVVLALIVGLRLMSSWIKWMLLALVVAAVVYLISGLRRPQG